VHSIEDNQVQFVADFFRANDLDLFIRTFFLTKPSNFIERGANYSILEFCFNNEEKKNTTNPQFLLFVLESLETQKK
jgi:hypothetical protein